MADLPTAEGGRPGGGGGSHWLAIGAIAGVGTLLFLMFKGQSSASSGNTTAAGTSINAALGSIQEQNLNLMGQLGAAQNALSTQASNYNQSELAALSGMGQALADQMNGIDTHITDSTDALNTQINTVNNGVIANGQALAGLGQNLTAYYNALIAAGGQQTQQVTDAQRSYYNALINAISQGTAQVNANTNAAAAGTNQAVANAQSGLGGYLTNITNWLYMINARVLGLPGSNPGNPNNWPGGQVPTWFSGVA